MLARAHGYASASGPVSPQTAAEAAGAVQDTSRPENSSQRDDGGAQEPAEPPGAVLVTPRPENAAQEPAEPVTAVLVTPGPENASRDAGGGRWRRFLRRQA
jgi:hypothetical protein